MVDTAWNASRGVHIAKIGLVLLAIGKGVGSFDLGKAIAGLTCE
jgi:hypothetical protein